MEFEAFYMSQYISMHIMMHFLFGNFGEFVCPSCLSTGEKKKILFDQMHLCVCHCIPIALVLNRMFPKRRIAALSEDMQNNYGIDDMVWVIAVFLVLYV